ncbi:arabinan endo-1,5-alpha-L-arabinosidase [Sphingomonas carotinifaciens]|uniref:Extracellular exo-alpha-(1->5)-L-arabinofuranosidase n=2 Tax=Sphingomonas carotinifaciens TaxID=1166323 RepID=A0A1G7J3V7_9SPHN|nr:arabinan endo-1,5-alpha-L-arabinosidase [Sphingomonas carotinifaciens]
MRGQAMRRLKMGLKLAAAALMLGAAAPQAIPLNDRITGDIAPVHDPVIIREGGVVHVFSTGLGEGPDGIIAHRVSRDMIHWERAPAPLAALPAWAKTAIPGSGNAWAPDISFVDGRYRLYYAVSTFGSNRSAIGLLTTPTLDPAKPGYGWRDEGLVVMSTPADDFNAIDAAFIRDRQGRDWLSLGSFWSGLKLFALDRKTGKPADPKAKPIAIASRPAPAGAPAPVEAPYIFEHGGWYWLLASYDYCCKGNASTYYTVVARSKAITGPYLGKDGSAMLKGGGTILLRADLQEKGRFRGPGHPGHFRDTDGTDYVVYHAYDREAKGAPTLRIAPLRWGADGWPTALN